MVGQSAAVSALVIGGMSGALGCAPLSDRLGRRIALLTLVLPLTLGTLLSAWATSAGMMVAGRLLCGLGVGAASVLAPTLLAELSPTKSRGMISLLTRLGYVVGMLASFALAGYLQSCSGTLADGVWRTIFLAPLLPVGLLAAGILGGVVPESPTWLVQQGRSAEGAEVMSRVQAVSPAAAREWAAVEEANMAKGEKKVRWADLLALEHRQSLTICTGLAVLHALSGSNMVVFFAATVFAGAGLGNAAAIATVAVGVANVVGTCVAAVLTDRLGRRPLVIASFTAMAACLCLLMASQLPPVVASYPAFATAAAVAAVPIFMVCFASGVGPVVYLLYSELFAARVRAKGRRLLRRSQLGWRVSADIHLPAALQCAGR